MIELNNDQAGVLLSAIEAINDDDKLFLQILQMTEGRKMFEKNQVKEFIDRIFSDPICLKKAWETPGFPFIGLNDIYRGTTGIDHPVFMELFKDSFISGPYGKREEELSDCVGFSLDNALYLDINKIFKDSSREQYLHIRKKGEKNVQPGSYA